MKHIIRKTASILLSAVMIPSLFSCGQKQEPAAQTNEQESIDIVIENFQKLAAVPRESGNEKAVSDMVKQWAESLGYTVKQNELYDLVFDVPATKGYESLPLTALQGHLDMVCIANEGVDYDPARDPIKVIVDKEKGTMTADGTSLGGDDGIGVSIIMAVAEGKMDHGPVRVILTTNEETNASGAKAITAEDLAGIKYFVNIDCEVGDTLYISSAASINLSAEADPIVVPCEYDAAYTIRLSGLVGGHSGLNIAEGRCNAIIELCRVLNDLKETVPFSLVSVSGGKAYNAIADSAEAVITAAASDEAAIQELVKSAEQTLIETYAGIESSISLTAEAAPAAATMLDPKQAEGIISYVNGCVNGVYSMSTEIEGLVETSANMGVIDVSDKNILIVNSMRSSSVDNLSDIKEQQLKLAENNGLMVTMNQPASAWPVDPDSRLKDIIPAIYEKQNGQAMNVQGVHAGLECGDFHNTNPDMDIVSLGPDIYDAHSPNETVRLGSIPVTWNLLRELLVTLE